MLNKLKLNGLRVLLVITALVAFGSAKAQIPSDLVPPPGHHIAHMAIGVGDQVYTSVLKPGTADQYMWTLSRPDAKLYNLGGHLFGTHYAGPTWQDNKTGSLVRGKKKKEFTVDPNSIPWLLLEGVAWAGHGKFSHVSYIQRLFTIGGLAPSDAPTGPGIEWRVPYVALYVFWEADDQDE